MKLSGRPLIYLISDGSIDEANFDAGSDRFLKVVESAVRAHLPLVQIREKRLSARRLFELTKLAVAAAQDSATKIIVNDRVDIALAAKADGVHLTSRSVAPEAIRKYFPADLVVGASTHSLDELGAAAKGGADFAVFGPIFESSEKPAAQGLDALEKAVEFARDFPVLALGGIDATNYKLVLETAAAGFAAIRFLNDIKSLEGLRAEFDL